MSSRTDPDGEYQRLQRQTGAAEDAARTPAQRYGAALRAADQRDRREAGPPPATSERLQRLLRRERSLRDQLRGAVDHERPGLERRLADVVREIPEARAQAEHQAEHSRGYVRRHQEHGARVDAEIAERREAMAAARERVARRLALGRPMTSAEEHHFVATGEDPRITPTGLRTALTTATAEAIQRAYLVDDDDDEDDAGDQGEEES